MLPWPISLRPFAIVALLAVYLCGGFGSAAAHPISADPGRDSAYEISAASPQHHDALRAVHTSFASSLRSDDQARSLDDSSAVAPSTFGLAARASARLVFLSRRPGHTAESTAQIQ